MNIPPWENLDCETLMTLSRDKSLDNRTRCELFPSLIGCRDRFFGNVLETLLAIYLDQSDLLAKSAGDALSKCIELSVASGGEAALWQSESVRRLLKALPPGGPALKLRAWLGDVSVVDDCVRCIRRPKGLDAMYAEIALRVLNTADAHSASLQIVKDPAIASVHFRRSIALTLACHGFSEAGDFLESILPDNLGPDRGSSTMRAAIAAALVVMGRESGRRLAEEIASNGPDDAQRTYRRCLAAYQAESCRELRSADKSFNSATR